MADTFLSTSELRNLSDKELNNELAKGKHNHSALKMAVVTGKEKAVHNVSLWKSYVARILTIKNEIKKTEGEGKTAEPKEVKKATVKKAVAKKATSKKKTTSKK